MTELFEQVFKIYDESKNRILLFVEASVPPDQFRALRKLILDELGLSGAEGKVKKLLAGQSLNKGSTKERSGTG